MSDSPGKAGKKRKPSPTREGKAEKASSNEGAEETDSWGILGEKEWARLMHGRRLKPAWESGPGAAPRARAWPPVPGGRKDLRVRDPTEEEQKAHENQYDKVKQKAKRRAKVAMRQLRVILARLDEKDALEILTAGDANAPDRPSSFELLQHEASARFGMTKVPSTAGGSGEYFIQRWLLAHEGGIGEAWTKEGSPGIALEIPPFTSATWEWQASLTKHLREQAEAMEGVRLLPKKEEPEQQKPQRPRPRMTIHEKPQRPEKRPRRKPKTDPDE